LVYCMNYRLRRLIAGCVMIAGIAAAILLAPDNWQQTSTPEPVENQTSGAALETLEKLPIKGRAPKTDYARSQFGDGWATVDGCDMRNIILHRDLKDPVVGENCKVLRGTLHDPYTGSIISFTRGSGTSD